MTANSAILTVRKNCAPDRIPAPNEPIRIVACSEHTAAEWDRFVQTCEHGSIFHTTAWMNAVRQSFSHRPHYMMAYRGHDLVAVLPLFEVRSLLAGTLLVSVPYAVYGGPLGDDRPARRALQDAACDLAHRLRARSIDLRTQRAVWTGIPVSERYVTYKGPLPDRVEDCLNRLPRKARAAARLARERHGLVARHDAKYLRSVWDLYAQNMRRLGSLSYPYRFFESLVANTPGQHVVTLVTHHDTPVAGLVSLIYNGVALPYFVGADDRARNLNLYNFIYLVIMERAVELGCHTFDFGRSRRDNAGACAFKKNQGFKPTTLQYQRFTPPNRTPPDLTPTNPRFKLARTLWPMMPGAVTRPLSAWLTRHIPG